MPNISETIEMPSILFFVFMSVALLAACNVILIKNPVQAVLSLIVCFISTAGTWLLLDAEFLAWALILVYVGAVMVLFLFVVMMLDIRALTSNLGTWLPIGLIFTTALILFLFMLIQDDDFVLNKHGTALAYGANDISNSKILGEYIFTKYLMQFEVAGIILLVAIIAAIGLIYRGPQDRKAQNIDKQINVNPKDRLELKENI